MRINVGIESNRNGNINRCYYILETLELKSVRDVTFQVALQVTNDPRTAAMVVSVSNGASLHDDMKTYEE